MFVDSDEFAPPSFLATHLNCHRQRGPNVICRGPVIVTSTGWYGEMLYPTFDAFLSLKPTVADVHTNPDGGGVLEVGVGRTNFVVAAINSGPDRRVYVG